MARERHPLACRRDRHRGRKIERDDEITITLPGGRQAPATLAGRDPSTDVAVLRFQPDGLAAADLADAATLRPGHLVLAIGSHDGAPIASLGIVGLPAAPGSARGAARSIASCASTSRSARWPKAARSSMHPGGCWA
jgi:hypothetical protein